MTENNLNIYCKTLEDINSAFIALESASKQPGTLRCSDGKISIITAQNSHTTNETATHSIFSYTLNMTSSAIMPWITWNSYQSTLPSAEEREKIQNSIASYADTITRQTEEIAKDLQQTNSPTLEKVKHQLESLKERIASLMSDKGAFAHLKVQDEKFADLQNNYRKTSDTINNTPQMIENQKKREKLFLILNFFPNLEKAIAKFTFSDMHKTAMIQEYKQDYQTLVGNLEILPEAKSCDENVYKYLEQLEAYFTELNRLCFAELDKPNFDNPEEFLQYFQQQTQKISSLELKDLQEYSISIENYLTSYRLIAKYHTFFKKQPEDILNPAIYNKADHLLSTFKTYHVSGITNVGNSCYVNAALQALLTQPNLIKRILDKNEPLIEAKTESESDFCFEERKKNYANRIAVKASLREFYHAYSNLSADSQTKTADVEKAARNLRQIFFDRQLSYDFSNINDLYVQQDSAAVLEVLFPLLDVKIPCSTQYIGTNSSGKVVDQSLNQQNDIMLRIPLSEEERSLQDLLKDYFAPHFFDRPTSEDIEPCTYTTQQHLEGSPPEMLVLQLMRFQQDKRGQSIKVTTKTRFSADEAIDLTNAFREPQQPAKYQVKAIIQHLSFGLGLIDSLTNGHYVSYVKKDLIDDEGNIKEQWYKCDDAKAQPIDSDKVPCGDAYCVVLALDKAN